MLKQTVLDIAQAPRIDTRAFGLSLLPEFFLTTLAPFGTISIMLLCYKTNLPISIKSVILIYFAVTMPSTGLAFSGGGIRSAAFCSGVLRRLLEYDVEVDYLSCVSGGGYTGTAFLDWKFREERR